MEVFSTATFTFQRTISVPGLTRSYYGLASCSINNTVCVLLTVKAIRCTDYSSGKLSPILLMHLNMNHNMAAHVGAIFTIIMTCYVPSHSLTQRAGNPFIKLHLLICDVLYVACISGLIIIYITDGWTSLEGTLRRLYARYYWGILLSDSFLFATM